MATPGSGRPSPVPLVLVHGLWDTPGLFRRLEERLQGRRQPLLVPHLPHGLGQRPLLEMACQLGHLVCKHFGPEQPVDLLGFSMGGVVARSWLQLAPWPRRWLASVADMRPGSPLLRKLNGDLSALAGVDCCSFWCLADTLVIPSWTGVLPVGRRQHLPVWHHKQLISSPEALGPIVTELLRP